MKLPLAGSALIFALLAASAAAAEPVAAPATPAPGIPAAAPNGSPKIKFAQPDFIFDKVLIGQPVVHEFWFTNIGNAPLLITSVTPSCHCTTAAAYSSEVAPGQAGVIPIRFDSTGQGGGQSKTITVMCNDRTQPALNLTLKGMVVVPMETSSSFVILSVKPDSTTDTSAIVNIHNNTDSPITLDNPTSNQPGVAAELKALQPGQDYELTIHTIAGKITNNALATITVKTSLPAYPLVTVMANVNFLQPVYFIPAQLILPFPGQANAPNSFHVTINNNSAKPLTLSEPAVDIPGAKLEVVEIDPGKQFQLNLAMPPGFEIPPGTNYTLSVKTSDPRYAFISVPIRQIPRPVPPGIRPQVPGAAVTSGAGR